MKRIKLTLGLSLLLLTGISTVLTNAVLLPFWAGDLLHRESEHLTHLLRMADQGAETVPRSLRAILDATPESCVYWKGRHYDGSLSREACRLEMQPILNTTLQTGAAQVSPRTISLFDLASSHYLYVTHPSPVNAQVIGGVGIPLGRALYSLWGKEKIIAIYLVINTLVVTAFMFFRLLKRYVLPVDRMVHAAETYHGNGMELFADDEGVTDELGRLASSIQAMVRRIEADKTRLRATVEELAEKNVLLEKNQKEMIRTEKLATAGRLAAGLAHEIGNPLGVVQGYVQLMGMQDCTADERADYADKALAELERVDKLIRRLLGHARGGSSDTACIDVNALLTDVLDGLQVQPVFRAVRLERHFDDGTLVLCAELSALRQVIVNCLLNAADAVQARHGASGGRILVTTRRLETPPDVPARMEIAIEDNGTGIPAALLDSVFEPFFTTKEPGRGTGLGLSVSLALIESMGGTMELHSIENEGTTVRIILPLTQADGQISSQTDGTTNG